MVDPLRPFAFALAALVAAWPGPPLPQPANLRSASSEGNGPRMVGRSLAAVVLVAVALLVAIAATPVPIGLIAYAGFFPLLRGLRQILTASFRSPTSDPGLSDGSVRSILRQSIAGGMDPLAVLIPLFATHTLAEIAAVASGTIIGSAALAPVRSARATALRPFGLILVGVYLLIEAGAFGWMWPR